MDQHIWRICYSWIASPIMGAAVHLLALNNRNLKAGLEGRKGLWQRLDAQLTQRDPQKPLIWFHVSSAGEFLQAQPVLERCMQHGYECAVTFTSVNGYKWIQRTKFPKGREPVVKDYLALDSARNMRRLLNTLQPSVIVYVKYDLWPNLVWEAHATGIPQYLIAATLQPKSKRLTSSLGRSFYRTVYACLDGIFAVTEDDQERFLSTNPEHPNLRIVGNTGFDSVLDRKKKLSAPKLPDEIRGKFVFIAGSTWPPDEECIFPALKEALQQYPEFFLIIAPHEPTTEHLNNSETFFKDFALERLTRLQKNLNSSEHHSTSLPGSRQLPRILLVDTVGVLSSLYAVGTLAYVGGAFTAGVHNVTEPGVMGLPVFFGPKHYNSPEAVDLSGRRLAFSVSKPDEFRSQLFQFLENPDQCKQLGRQAKHMVESQAGAADRCFQLITTRITHKNRIYDR